MSTASPVIVIVGGGPVGLYTCLLLLDRYNDIEIVILEKRPEYIRKHHVAIKDCAVPTTAYQRLEGRMEIQAVESTLRKQIQKFRQVRWMQAEVNGGIEEWLPCYLHKVKPTMIIFANGARSKERDLYFEGTIDRFYYMSACSATYQVHGRTKTLAYNHQYRLQKLLGCYFQENVSSNTQNVRLTIIGVYNHQELQQKVNVIINARRVELGDCVVEESCHYSFFELDTFRAQSVYTRWKHEVDLYLVGDAAAGIPFQRGLNTGFECARSLVKNRKSYPKHFQRIMRESLQETDTNANFLNHYLSLTMFFRNSALEFQRWSRDYEKILLQSHGDTTSSQLINHKSTRDRKLVLEWWKDMLVGFIDGGFNSK